MAGDMKAFFEEWPARSQKAKSMLPETVGGFNALFKAAMGEGALSVKEKECIALGMALALRCEPCINLHVKKCLEAGASREQIMEVAGVAVMMQGGPGFTYLPKVVEVLESLEEKKS